MACISFVQPIYTYDIDFAGHVSNISYIRWMEIGRLKLLAEAGMPVATLVAEGIFPALAGTTIAYKSPLFLEDSVRIEVWISKLRYASADMAFHFWKEPGILAAEGIQKGLFIDSTKQKPVRISDAYHAQFARFTLTQKK